MKLGIDVDITIKAPDGAYVTIPVVPEEITYDDGSGTPTTVSVLNIGNIDFYNGVELDTLSFSSFFPARYDAGYCRYPELKKPTDYRNQISSWKGGNTGTYVEDAAVLQVIIPAAGINKSMKVSKFTWKFKGFEGDIYYDITFKEEKTITPIQASSGVVVAEETREPEPVPEPVKEIVKGSTVKFKGGPVYTSANATRAAATRGEATCECTIVYNGSHPFHLIGGGGSGGANRVYGWCDAENCEAI